MVMRDPRLHRARIVSSVAATVISLACGTNYVYSAWAPQFADRLHLSATQSNLIGLFGNLGMYTLGVPSGLLVDHRGPRSAVVLGACLLGLGYFPFRAAYDHGRGSVPALCFFSFLSGLGGCMAFAAAVKTSALNWPHHRGTATAFPLAAFGLSAFFFSTVGHVLSGDTGAFLLLLAVGTSGLTLLGFFFLRVLPPHHHSTHHASYHPVPAARSSLSDSQRLRRTSSAEDDKAAARAGRGGLLAPDLEPGTSSSPTSYTNPTAAADGGAPGRAASASATATAAASASAAAAAAAPPSAAADDEDDGGDLTDETSSLVSRASSLPGEVLVLNSVDLDRSHRVDIRGWRLLRSVDFWQLFAIMGLLAGIGLMTINNIGHDTQALWKHHDDSVGEEFLIGRQRLHVSVLSAASFLGRLLSGIGSDFLVKVLKASRVWCLVVASLIFCVAQVCALRIGNPHLLGLVSGLSGLGYGFLFGVFPSIVAETFGIHGLSQNWGFMTLSPVLSGAVFNQFYGVVFDHHSVVGPNGERSCLEGLACYAAAYRVTLGACGLGLLVTLFTIRHQHRVRREEEQQQQHAPRD